MKNILFKTGLCTMLLGALAPGLKAQTAPLRLTLQEAISQAKTSNKSIAVMKTAESAARLDLEDVKAAALPRIATHASYQRYSKVTLFDDVLGGSHQVPKPPNANGGSLGLEASFNLYSGGRQHAMVNDMKQKNELALLNTKEQEANVSLQVTLQYLALVRYYFQEQLIEDQVARARLRLKNIGVFYANGKVTKSDVLRADVQLSNALLSEDANRNDYLISNQQLNNLLNLDAGTRIVPVDTATLNLADSAALEALRENISGAYAILKARKNTGLQENRTRLARSFNLPSAALFGGYGLNYPNTLVFPPVAQTVGVGQLGVKLTYDISSLYHNKNKIKASRLRETQLRLQEDRLADNVRQEARALTIKYHEAVNRMQVVKKSIEQAEANYNIQNTKYANQLSLLTDLLEADNLYQESRFNYIQANIAALSIYYRLLFLTGKL
jgi:outer membrane protein TolC